MFEFTLNDEGVWVKLSDGPGDLQAKIQYDKLPTLKTLGEEERKQFGAILAVVCARLTAELKMQANAVCMQKLKAIAGPELVVPPEKKVIVGGY